jgi:hypothetical protein
MFAKPILPGFLCVAVAIILQIKPGNLDQGIEPDQLPGGQSQPLGASLGKHIHQNGLDFLYLALGIQVAHNYFFARGSEMQEPVMEIACNWEIGTVHFESHDFA